MKFPDIPQSWLIAFLLLSLVVMRCFGIDSFTTAALSLVVGYITGKHVEQGKNATKKKKEKVLPSVS